MKSILLLIFLIPFLCSAEESKSSAYEKSQDDAIAHFKGLAEAVKTGTVSETTISENSINYLTAVYLLCMVGNGTCPIVLQGVFETDLLNSIASGQKGCPLMKKFWIAWKETDMEKRHQFQIKPAHTQVFLKFQKEVLPKYTNCDATINSILKDCTKDIVRSRYTASGSPETGVFGKLAGLLDKIKAKVPNVFIATQSVQNVDSEQ